jgi:hypothetical protein
MSSPRLWFRTFGYGSPNSQNRHLKLCRKGGTAERICAICWPPLPSPCTDFDCSIIYIYIYTTFSGQKNKIKMGLYLFQVYAPAAAVSPSLTIIMAEVYHNGISCRILSKLRATIALQCHS